jgi:PAS domain S-box-containing protein
VVERILNAVADGLFTVDEGLLITTFNRAAETITGFSRAEAIGRPCSEVFRTRLCLSRCPLKESMATGRTVTNQEIVITTASEEFRSISVNTAALTDDDGRFVGAVETFRDLSRIKALERELAMRHRFGDVVSRNPLIRRMCEQMPVIAESDATVLIEGRSGTGKGLFARSIHERSGRTTEPFVHVNCGALPEGLLEAELFGHVKGAFTDAARDRVGRFEAAGRGTIFLDEIGDASLSTQVKLLRVLQEREFERVGSSQTLTSRARVVAATNVDLREAVAKGRFREDLYYRLSVFRVRLPDLAERREDIPLLAKHFLEAQHRRSGRGPARLAPEVMRILMVHPFPGNVRELENIVEHACIVASGDEITSRDLPELIVPAHFQAPAHGSRPKPRLQVSKAQLRSILEANEWNVPRVADELGVHRSTAWRMLKRHDLDPPR